MKLTKFAHSCFTLEKDNQVLVVDPGLWSSDFVVPTSAAAVVVTHEHADHFDTEKLRAIVAQNPKVVIYGPEAVTSQIADLPVQAISADETVEIGGFTLDFVGGAHATIHANYTPDFQNVGVIINDLLYHPGDSLVVPNRPIKLLSLPIVAPWEKVSESMDFLAAVKPTFAFPSHDKLLSAQGIEVYDRMHQMVADKHGITYQRLSEPVEI